METTKIITSTKDFATALEQVEKIIDTKSSNYLLRSAFIQAEDGKMKISANNLEVIGCKTIVLALNLNLRKRICLKT